MVKKPKQQSQAAPDIVIITGLSGSGMTSATNAFEDLGYFCVDNMPLTLLQVADDVELEFREVDPPPVQDQLMLGEIQDRVVLDLELRGDEPGQPAIDR